MSQIKTIALSEDTATLLDCKKMLDGCFDKLGKIQNDMFGYDWDFESRLALAYTEMNDLIMKLLADSIDAMSTESKYEVI